MPVQLLHHALGHARRNPSLRVPGAALRSIAVQALYDGGFEGPYR